MSPEPDVQQAPLSHRVAQHALVDALSAPRMNIALTPPSLSGRVPTIRPPGALWIMNQSSPRSSSSASACAAGML